MDKKAKFEAIVAGAGKKAKEALGAAIQAVDQNADGKFDIADVAVVTESVGNAMKKTAQTMKENAEERARLTALKELKPLFLTAEAKPVFATPVDDAYALDDIDFAFSKLIRFVERDEKHAKSELCKDSIGFMSNFENFRVVNIFRDSIDSVTLTFYPDCDSECYYVDPTDRDHYIALEDYFDYLRSARVNELKKLAQDLGAKYYKITLREEKTSFKSKKIAINTKVADVGNAQAEHSESAKKYSSYKIEGEMHFAGRAPVAPQLKYLRQNLDIKTLVAMRMDPDSPLIKERYELSLSQSSGIKKNDAVKIDAALKKLEVKGNTTVSGEVQNESRRSFIYEIEF